ncbi:MAG: hypothetical protein LGR52_15600 [Candidatus Thiosymbion ectosymbiont of Robbea hypermnestra]|nr:hypothetical protein [Candidatus Thiosymbion ectosymbiont of Robbea hypermnestra]
MSTQLRIISLLAILAVGFLILDSGDEPADSDHQGGDPESTTDRHLQPREPTLPTPAYDYGIVGQPGPNPVPPPYGGHRASPFAVPSHGERRAYPEPPYPDAYRGGYNPPHTQARTRPGGYRFRPLTEREHKRRQTSSYPDQYATPYHPYPQAQSTVPPYPSSAPPTERYSFRPQEKSPGARGRWQGPYRQPDRYPAPSTPTAPEASPPYPQWGSTPPSQRMYPNLYRNPDCRLTAR